ncbi:multidrug ABC transporter [Niastella yeongjuensis]|uniref:Multidrug ABC transporter n=2 Tax=Niastella yeongjuensis TaxID=354355 RepID=A0A1V9E1S7_9BACT|nr:ABC transporter ATP-binding protein [Niastella yeongjuensis]OQP40021.1 multidrug ABC transporter [Niastella yeongjuensis]SEO13848.1 ATP-binding cassette, subfamily B [Niastella yeongjuensis]
MNYQLNTGTSKPFTALRKLMPIIKGERRVMSLAFMALIANTLTALIVPIIIAHTINTSIITKDFSGVVRASALVFALYLVGFVASYFQTRWMGAVGQHILFSLRNQLFSKLQSLPVAFFSQNKAGDLISRINNDTDKLNQFFSQGLLQFVGNLFMMIGAAVFILAVNIKLGLAALAPAMIVLLFTKFMSPWIKKRNAASLQTVGSMSAEIQEGLDNFKVVVAFNRRDYFSKRFATINNQNYRRAVAAGVANNIFIPSYGLAGNVAQIIVLFFGIFLLQQGQFTIGFMISYFVYLSRFYDPMRQIAGIWPIFQVAMAGWDRISAVLAMESDMPVMNVEAANGKGLLEFREVSFKYGEKEVLRQVNFTLERGKTYAFVGPTGGGKTTTASLIARLYDPVSGQVLLDGKDIRTYKTEERTQKIGFILQEPFLFTGTLYDNILYGNEKYQQYSREQLNDILQQKGLLHILERFDKGLQTPVTSKGESMSLGQRQLIAFVRALLREPELLILDEATANIDTVTEQLLGEILDKLPAQTTQIIIAHRLNTIEKSDEIFFVNAGQIIQAGSFDHAIRLLMEGKRVS